MQIDDDEEQRRAHEFRRYAGRFYVAVQRDFRGRERQPAMNYLLRLKRVSLFRDV